MFSTIRAVESRTYGFVRSMVRRRFVWRNVKGIDADTRGEEEKEKRRTRRKEKRRGMEGDAAVIIVLVASRLRTRRV